MQRPLKLAEHLAPLGHELHVLAPTDPRWVHADPLRPIPSSLRVHRVPYIGPRGRLPAQELYGLDGLERLLRRALLTPRRLLVPDENISWVATVAPAAVRIARRERIEAVVTTSPPGSVHLAGAAVRRAVGIPWIADLRDSLVAKPDRAYERMLVRAKERPQQLLARLVARSADAVVAVTETIAAEIERLHPRARVVVIPNGCDFEEFEGLRYERDARMRVTHTGSFFGKRDPRPFLQALAESDPTVVARFAGDFRPSDRDWASSIGLNSRLELLPMLPHTEALALQRNSDVLLLLLPEIGERGRDVPSAKLYEYLAAGRPIIAAVTPTGTAAALVREANAGLVVPPDDVAGLSAALRKLLACWRADELREIGLADGLRERLSRRTQAQALADLLAELR